MYRICLGQANPENKTLLLLPIITKKLHTLSTQRTECDLNYYPTIVNYVSKMIRDWFTY